MLEVQRNQVESLRAEAEHLLQQTDYEDKVQWYEHPCTQSLIKGITADILDLQNDWAEGAHTTDNEAETLQKNAKHIGMAKAANDVLEVIEAINKEPEKKSSDKDS